MLLVDYIGSFSLRNDWVRELRSVGADVVGGHVWEGGGFRVEGLGLRVER